MPLQDLVDAFSAPALTAAGVGLAVALVTAVLLVLTKRWHGALTNDDTQGVQKFHCVPTPRVGGVAIVMGLLASLAFAPDDVQDLLWPVVLAGMPAFILGLAEDITKRVGVLPRLWATMASGLLACWLTDQSLSRVDVAPLDWLLKFSLVSVLFTVFAVGGVANAINIIDGFNGLASTMAGLAFAGYALLAWQANDMALASAALVLAACVWGFFWVNWPLGKLFLGDGGSYFVGFALAWTAVLLIERNPDVSAFAVLLVCVHPVTEVLFSIYRRRIKRMSPGQPDRLHFHSLFKKRYARRWFAQSSSVMRNSMTGLLMGSMTIVAVVLAGITIHSVWLSALALLGLVLGYVALYARMVRYHWCSPIAFLLTKPRGMLVRNPLP